MKKRLLCVLHPNKKKEWKDGVLLTKYDYSRTEETVIDKTFEWNTEDVIM